MGENDKVRSDSLKNYIFFHSGTNRKHNIIYKLTYTIIINHLHKFSPVSSLQKICFRLGIGDQNLFGDKLFLCHVNRRKGK